MHHDFFYAAETALRSNSGMHCLVDEQGKQKENIKLSLLAIREYRYRDASIWKQWNIIITNGYNYPTLILASDMLEDSKRWNTMKDLLAKIVSPANKNASSNE